MKNIQTPGKIFVISASSGAGKTTLVNLVLEKLKPTIYIDKVITYTTREPRKSEVPGLDYHFICKEEFLLKIEEGFFIEWSQVYGNYYGSPKYILDELPNKSWILILDFAGAKTIKESVHDSVLIWIEILSLEILEQRLKLRGDLPEQIQKRLMLAKNEFELINKNLIFDYKFKNDVLKDSITCLEQIILFQLNNRSDR
ncbi:MAG: hypothetical protein P4L22_03790 [Candidatus Babeliales bacterium]|nr:hypothetical protein [Candidatus Babeliales bacterium]